MVNLNSNVQVKQVENLLVIDPNGVGSNGVNTEDLSISVELEVFERGEEPIIFSDDYVTTTNDVPLEATRISFIDGSGDEGKHLTTHYTELNTKFNDDNKNVGTLGIESIDIGFNTSYTPIVKIRFKDIRAKLFELGEESPYSFLFRMPYPIFYLTVKGYYGKPVKYALHLTKFNGELDNETGSFIITCDFIGYTYAFLSDLLMGVLKGIPYTQDGIGIIDKQSDFITFSELILTVKKLEETITNFKNSNEKLKALSIFNDLNTKLDGIKEKLIIDLVNINGNYSMITDTNLNGSDYLSYSHKSYDLTKNEIELYENSTLKLVNEYNSFNDNKGSKEQYELDIDNYQLDNNGIYIEGFEVNDFLRFTQFNEPIGVKSFDEFITDNDIIKKYPNYNNPSNKKIEKYYNDFISIINHKFKSKSGNGYILSNKNLLDIRFALDEINELKLKINDDYNEKKEEVDEEFLDTIDSYLKSDESTFDASIGSLFKILCNHVDLFIKVIKKVEGKIKSDIDSGNRNLPASEKGNFTEYIDGDGSTEISVKAFPEYIVDEGNNSKNKSIKVLNELEGGESDDEGVNNGGLVEKWLGSNLKFSNYAEVKFINDLFHSIMESAKKDTSNLKSLSSKENKLGWYPINPLETKAFDNDNVNPWTVISDSNSIESVYKLTLQRMALFLGYSNSNLILEDVIDMAKIEANQLHEILINPNIKNGVMPSGADNNTYNVKIKEFLGDFINSFGKMGDGYDLRFYFNNNKIFGEDDGDGSQTYRHEPYTSLEEALEDTETYIPITQTISDIKNKENSLNNFSTRSSTLNTFISSVVSNTKENENSENLNEYETFIKIIDVKNYKKTFKYNNYINERSSKLTKSFTSNTNISEVNDFYGGVYKTHEFIKYKHSEFGEIPLFYEFYDKSLKLNLVNKLKNNIKTKGSDTHQPSFLSNEKTFSLFGSEFYYAQEEAGKALLFLHTIPFDGMIQENGQLERTIFSERNLKFFNERAGFVSIPKSWSLLLGGLLHRDSEDVDILKYVDGNTSLIPNININDININKDELLIYTFVSGNIIDGPVNARGNGSMNFKTPIGGNNQTKYQVLSDVIKKLPKSVKKVFIDDFTNWVKSDWLNLKTKLEIFKADITATEINDFTNSFKLGDLNTTLLNISVSNSYESYQINKSGGNNFDLTIKYNSDTDKALTKFLVDNKILINGTYRIWSGNNKRFKRIKFSNEFFTKYLETFLNTLKDLNSDKKNIIDPDSQLKIKLFETDNVDDIKLSLYKNIKSIYNKWIVGVHPSFESVIVTELYKSFNFYDRAYIDISEKFKISPTGFAQELSKASNISFYNFIASILSANNFDFIPLPNFIDYSSTDDVKGMFEPVRFNDVAKTSGPQFICMYFGEHSNKLNIDKNKKVRNDDSFSIPSKYDKDGNLIIGESNIPKDFKKGNQTVPYFLVNYADQNQSLFKKITVNQSEFTETNESLEIIDSLSAKNRNNSIGQNLFDIYNNRAYSAEVEMLGCAQIQPFMFFQINNVPIFDGAYTIINTRHNIKPNHMTTTFKGVRIRRIKTKMIDDKTLYSHLLTNLNEVDNEDGNLNAFSNIKAINTTNTSVETIYAPAPSVEGENGLLIQGIVIED